MNPWETPEGQACFERWIAVAMGKLNAYDGTAEFNGRKPWSINKYGVLEGGPHGPHSVGMPDAFPAFGYNRYWWMWAHYLVSGDGLWPNANWNGAGVPALQPFVTDCLAT